MTEKRPDDETGPERSPLKQEADDLLDTLRWWVAGAGGLGGAAGGAALIVRGEVGTVPGIGCLVLAACSVVAAFFGARDRDLGGWAGAFTALVLGIAALVLFLAALGA